MKAYLGIALGDKQEKFTRKDGKVVVYHYPTMVQGLIGSREELYDIEQLDSYIARNYANGEEIRNDPRYKQKIDFHLGIHQHIIEKFTKNKRGSIVIIVMSEMGRERRMRVLYNKDLIKTVPKYMLSRISEEMGNLELEDVISIYDDNKAMFSKKLPIDTSPVDNIEECIKLHNNNDSIDKDTLKNVITYNMMTYLENMLNSKVRVIHSNGYGYIRLLDSYLKNEYKIETTKVDKVKKYTLHTNYGDGKVYGIPKGKAKLERGQIAGQYSFDFTQDDNNKKLEKK